MLSVFEDTQGRGMSDPQASETIWPAHVVVTTDSTWNSVNQQAANF